MGILAINSDPLKLWGENYDPSTNDSSANVDPNPQDPSTNDSSARFVITPSTVEFTADNINDPVDVTYTFDGHTYNFSDIDGVYLDWDSAFSDTGLFSITDVVSCYPDQLEGEEYLTETWTATAYFYPDGIEGEGEHFTATVTVSINNVLNPYYSSGEGE